jgi:hypothetical protein
MIHARSPELRAAGKWYTFRAIFPSIRISYPVFLITAASIRNAPPARGDLK